MAKAEIKFGTDGWRAIIAEDFTFDNVRLCAQGIADYLKAGELGEQGLVIGYDTRFGSENFAAAAAEIIAGNDITVYLCSKPAPTPVVSYTVGKTKAAGAIIITASHNPGAWNGLKYKSQDGASAPVEVTNQIEANIARISHDRKIKRLAIDKGVNQRLINYLDPSPAYFKQINKLVDVKELLSHQITIAIDPMYGAGIGYFKTLLSDGNITLWEINNERNPLFPGIQPEPIAKNLSRLSKLVVKQKANVGLATDGDADRLGIIDEHGKFLNQHQVFALLCLYLLEIRGERGAMVKTLTSTDMIAKLGEIFDVPVYETPVGFKYVAPVILRENALIGGEESGGYGFKGHIPERDGILAGLYFIDFMAKTGKTPSQLLDYLYSKVGPHFYDRIDITIGRDKRQSITNQLTTNPPDSVGSIKVTKVNTADGFRFYLENKSWLLIRFSGTEPLVRIYAEAESPDKVVKLLGEGRKIVRI
ncbi:MAG: phosphoglucomutase/phosphomannomutase family protein [Dehalococcoidia bacterium]|nr:phosphoglucomutase/phosphomannomutase family protein [Dehalococcoidia bacterium]